MMARVRAADRPARLRLAASAVAAIVATLSSREAHDARLMRRRRPSSFTCAAPGPRPAPTSRSAVATRIGYDPFFATASKTVIAQISRAKAGYRGKIQIIGDDGVIRGERKLATRGDDCSELVSTLAP